MVFNESVVTNLANLQEDFTEIIRPFFPFLFLIILLVIFDRIYLCLIKESVVTNLTEIK